MDALLSNLLLCSSQVLNIDDLLAKCNAWSWTDPQSNHSYTASCMGYRPDAGLPAAMAGGLDAFVLRAAVESFLAAVQAILSSAPWLPGWPGEQERAQPSYRSRTQSACRLSYLQRCAHPM